MIVKYSGLDAESDDGRWIVIVHASGDQNCDLPFLDHMAVLGRNDLLGPDKVSREEIPSHQSIVLSTVEHCTREDRAFDALIVSTLRSAEDLDPMNLPELTEEEKAADDAIPNDFVQNLIEEHDRS